MNDKKDNCLVLGIGSPLNRDDRAGLLVVELLEERGVQAQTASLYSPGFELIDKILDFDRVVIVDAASFGHKPGTVTLCLAEELAQGMYTNMSHALSINQALELGHLCFKEEMPKDIALILIEAGDMTPFSDQLTPEVAESVAKAADEVDAYLARPWPGN